MHMLLFAIQVLKHINTAISVGKEVAEFARKAQDALEKMHAENRGPTNEEWAELNAEIEALRKELHG